MALRNIDEIGFKEVQLFKDQTLGIGAYGKVCRARCDNLDCAAKLLHETLFDRNAEQMISLRREHRLPLRRFEKECEFLNVIKHPNIIQYLGMCQDHTSGLAVLLMELMDCSLTNYLETSLYIQSSGVPFHVQVNVCHDITLALSFLHSNGIIHRDLSGNNILLSGQPNIRAKVTDFGMASLSDQLSPRQASYFTYTMCPGTDAYMPPEAVKEQPMYSKKIDCFSFGVIVVQILTKKFPKPKDRLKEIQVNGFTAFVPVSECERRQEHIDEADPNSPLIRVALNCLKDKDVDRPSSQQLCDIVGRLRETRKYRESAAQVAVQNEQLSRSSTGNEETIRELQVQIQDQRHQIRNLHQTCQSQAEQFDRQLAQKDEVIEQKEQTLLQKNALVQEKEEVIIRLEQDLRSVRNQLQATSLDRQRLEEELTTHKERHAQEIYDLRNTIQNQADHFTKIIQERDQIVKDQREDLDHKEIALVQKEEKLSEGEKTIEAGQREIQQLKQQLDQERARRMHLESKVLMFEQQQLTPQNSTPQRQIHYPTPALVSTTRTEVEQRGRKFSLRWGEGWNMPCPMERGCDAVVKGSIVYFAAAGSTRVYNFSSTDNTCFSLPDCPLYFSSLAIINDLLTAVGGSQLGSSGNTKSFSNKLFSFTDSGVWFENFPHMLTRRDSTTSLNTGTLLIVAGGRNKVGGNLNIVEVLNTETLQWSSAPSLPMPLRNSSAAMCGSEVYFLGGVDRDFFGSKTVFTCSVNALSKSCEPKSLGARLMSSVTSSNMWSRVADLPTTKSTCASFCGYLLAIGGEDLDYVPTKAVYMYNPMLNNWSILSKMSVARSNCVVASLPGNRLMVGGRAGAGRNNNVEFASIS